MSPRRNKDSQIFFNQSFDKKRLKALISWVFKSSGEAEALKAIDLLKETGFRYATKAGISIGLHDLTTPIQKSWLISESQLSMNTTNRDFSRAKITATERSQRIIDTWHRASESLSKQVVDYFSIYDRFNPVYIMALSGARGNFSQVRQLIGMRGLMADQQGKIVNFPIQSNLREGLTLTEYFISCSGARKGLVDTALRTADTGYLTRRLVDVSHHVVVKKLRCNTARGIAFGPLQSYNKVLLSLKERLVGRVLAENVALQGFALDNFSKSYSTAVHVHVLFSEGDAKQTQPQPQIIAEKDKEISLELASKIVQVRDKVYLRSPLTCGFTHTVCQLCYGWSISQGSLVALGDAVGVIAAQSIGEPGTQLTMRTFHTGGVFSGDLLQEIRAPHPGKICFSKAFQGLLIRTAHGRIAFLSKTQGSLILSNNHNNKSCTLRDNSFFSDIPIPAFTMLFVRQGEKVEVNQLLASFSIRTKEGNQPIKTEQTVFAQLTGRVIEDCSGRFYTKQLKESALLLNSLQEQIPFCKQKLSHGCRAKKNVLARYMSFTSTLPRRKLWSTYSPQKVERLFRLQGLYVPATKGNTEGDARTRRSLQDLGFVRFRQDSSSRCTSSLRVRRENGVTRWNCKTKICNWFLRTNRTPYSKTFSRDLIFSRTLAKRFRKGITSTLLCKQILNRLKKKTSFSTWKSQILSSHKREDLEDDVCKDIEPVRSGRLGFLKILSTRLGATLDYRSPIKSFTLSSVKEERIESLKKGIDYTNLGLALQSFNFLSFINKIESYEQLFLPSGQKIVSKENRFWSSQRWIPKEFTFGKRKPCFCNAPAFRNRFVTSRAFRNQTSVERKALDEPVKPSFASSYKVEDLEFSFSNFAARYLHPEFVKENRFFLQTIAEYGDIVDETYRHKSL